MSKVHTPAAFKAAVREVKKLITAAKERERNHRFGLRYEIKHSQYVRASQDLAWAQQQEAFREGLETALRHFQSPEEK